MYCKEVRYQNPEQDRSELEGFHRNDIYCEHNSRVIGDIKDAKKSLRNEKDQ